jgi:hypothetical protein
MDPEKVRAVKECKEPINVKGIQSFTGFTNFYRRFICDFSKITTLSSPSSQGTCYTPIRELEKLHPASS